MPKKTSRPKSSRNRGERRISIRTAQRDSPDLQKLGRAMIVLAVAQAQAEAEAQAQNEGQEPAVETNSRAGAADD
jgi:hypothetical protein